MPKIFVSYSRVDKRKVGQIVDQLRSDYGHENVFWDEDFRGGDLWWDKLLGEIGSCHIFVYMMSSRSIGAPYCQAELEEAERLHKHILPVRLRRGTAVPDVLARLHYVELTGRISSKSLVGLRRSINELANKPASTQPPLRPDPVRKPDVPHAEPRSLTDILIEYSTQIMLGVLITVLGGAILWQMQRPSDPVPASQPPVRTATRPSDTPATATVIESTVTVQGETATNRPSLTPSSTRAFTATFTASRTPTLSNFAALQTAQAQRTQDAETQAALEQTATADQILNDRRTATARRIMETEAAAEETLLALSWTPTPTSTPTPTATPDVVLAARAFSGGNADWQAQYPDGLQYSFDDGVRTVLVPAGCFMMGSDDGDGGERPVHQQCFEAPFWIDRTEVTQADFARLGGEQERQSGFSGADRPVERITWFEARDFCALRGARLPTEAEWEYAARGPDSLAFPWGNAWNEDNAVWYDNSGGQTAPVGSRPAGRSWVGADDMTGNVSEWTSSLYEPYPYAAGDGREADTGTRTDVLNVVRGGSWVSGLTGDLRAAGRLRYGPGDWGNYVGFRCARSS
jgi:formylglycine-generating enzyme required for sulfatase activity